MTSAKSLSKPDEQSALARALGAGPQMADDAAVIAAVLAFANREIRPSWKCRAHPVAKDILEMWAKNARQTSADIRYLLRHVAEHQTIRSTSESARELIASYPGGATDARADEEDAIADAAEASLSSGRWWNPTTPSSGEWDHTLDQTGAMAAAETQLDAERDFAVATLDCAVHGTTAVANCLRRLSSKRVGAIPVVLAPSANIQGNKVTITWNAVGDSSDSRPWVHFAVMLLASRARGERLDVGRCNLESCQRFFLIDWTEGNRPRTKYCCPEHRIEHHQRHAAERKRKSRAARKQTSRPQRRPAR